MFAVSRQSVELCQ